MNEQQRMQYLDVLGIEMYVPRWVLPGAKASPQAMLPQPLMKNQDAITATSGARPELPHSPQADHVVEVLDEPVSRAASPTQVSETVGSIMDELRGKARTSADEMDQHQESELDHSVIAGEKKPQEKVAFSLGIWRVTDHLMIIDSRAVKEALPTTALLQNILLAKNINVTLQKPEILNWPMFDSAQLSGDWIEASEMVCAFLRARLDQKPVKYLWLMGESAHGALNGGPHAYQQDLGLLKSVDGFDLLTVVMPSLSDMLKNPASKAITWRAIRDLN